MATKIEIKNAPKSHFELCQVVNVVNATDNPKELIMSLESERDKRYNLRLSEKVQKALIADGVVIEKHVGKIYPFRFEEHIKGTTEYVGKDKEGKDVLKTHDRTGSWPSTFGMWGECNATNDATFASNKSFIQREKAKREVELEYMIQFAGKTKEVIGMFSDDELRKASAVSAMVRPSL